MNSLLRLETLKDIILTTHFDKENMFFQLETAFSLLQVYVK